MLYPHRILNLNPNRHKLSEPLVVRQADLSISSRSFPMFKNVNGAVNLTSPLVEQIFVNKKLVRTQSATSTAP
jgi:hypothetical protein